MIFAASADSEITPAVRERPWPSPGCTLIRDTPIEPLTASTPQHSVYVGRDARLSSTRLAAALKEGLIACGCNVIDLGEITTPALNFAVHHGNQSGNGIMVTASHNPATYNGFKIILQHQVISGETLQQLIPMMRDEKLDSDTPTKAQEV